MTVTNLISILQTMPPAAVVVLGEHNRETVVAVRKFDIALVALREVRDEYRQTYRMIAGDDNELQGCCSGEPCILSMFYEVKCPRCGTQHAAVSREDVAQIIARNPGAKWKDFEQCFECSCSSKLFVPTRSDDPPVLTMPVVVRPE